MKHHTTTRPAYRVARRFGEIWIERMDGGRWVVAEPGCPSYPTLKAASEALFKLMESETMTVIQFSNLRAHTAVIIARINPCIETRTELRDALNERRNIRARHRAPVPKAVTDEVSRQIRTWGRIEDPRAVASAWEGGR